MPLRSEVSSDFPMHKFSAQVQLVAAMIRLAPFHRIVGVSVGCGSRVPESESARRERRGPRQVPASGTSVRQIAMGAKSVRVESGSVTLTPTPRG